MENKNISFEQAMSRLNEIITQLESEQTSLEKSVELFQEGIELSKICNSKLSNIEDRVAKIMTANGLEDYTPEG
ncbi:MAG: exodeoxyribonuclease VII small subunit [Erysipelotrichaceae bacterium]|nr:exodeoxyribonuclease VII small subunit [Erysipelotrichaceae bacterium]MDD3808717.1 exodeoxyribonuclease VII small subunit [Erysipelotrichaceae bacterium]